MSNKRKENRKRKIPTMLSGMLELDVRVTKMFVRSVENVMPKLKLYYKMLEISCHGIIWIASLLACIWIFNSKNLYQVQVNLLVALVLDIIVVAILKSTTRRRRPAVNDDPFSIGPDKYSFPSGHASRSMLVLYFFKYLWPLPDVCLSLISIWVFVLVVSRLLMRRHYILDIIAGLLVGYVQGMLMSFLYLEPETCSNLVYWITDEKLDGAEYDV